MFSDLISLIFPQNCMNCQRSLISEEEYLCLQCKIDLPLTYDNQNQDNDLYKKFAFESKIKSATSFLFFYRQGIAQKLLHGLKYQNKEGLGILMGKWFAESLTHLTVDIIIPVPLHKSKKRRRGYNQSDTLAAGVSEKLGVEFKTNVVKRIISTSSQTSKSRTQRWTDLENVYSIPDESVKGMRVLLIDDVITTGATIGMLASRMVEAEVSEIHIACIARGN